MVISSVNQGFNSLFNRYSMFSIINLRFKICLSIEFCIFKAVFCILSVQKYNFYILLNFTGLPKKTKKKSQSINVKLR